MVSPVYKICLWLAVLLTASACRKEPNYDVKPEISYNSITHKTQQDELGSPFESITFEINFKDGDGNLGLENSPNTHPDLQPPFAFLRPEGGINRYYYNFFVETFVKRNGVFVPYVLPNPNFPHHGRFMRLSQDERIEPLEGSLRYTLRLSPDNQLRSGTIVRFRLAIADRALNESNMVETDEIVLFRD